MLFDSQLLQERPEETMETLHFIMQIRHITYRIDYITPAQSQLMNQSASHI
jgi:hypothetical protein